MYLLAPHGLSLCPVPFHGRVWPAYTGSGFKVAMEKLRRAWELMGSVEYAKYERSFDAFLWMHGTTAHHARSLPFFPSSHWALSCAFLR